MFFGDDMNNYHRKLRFSVAIFTQLFLKHCRFTFQMITISKTKNLKRMKKIMLMSGILLSVLIMPSCSKDALSDVTITEAEALAGGSWKVVYYYDNSDGVSNDFDGYTFEIGDDGTITATNGASSYTGTWLVKSSDDDPDYSKEIEFTIAGDKQMDKLDGKWLIAELTETTMQLKDDTPSEEIHLEKI